MASPLKLVLLGGLAAVTLMATSSDAVVTCYSCNGTGCEDPFVSAKVKQTCLGYSCTKWKATALNTAYVIRGCTTQQIKSNNCNTIKNTGGGRSCLCRTSLCNKGVQVSPKPGNWLQLLMLLFVLVFTMAGRVDCCTSDQQ